MAALIQPVQEEKCILEASVARAYLLKNQVNIKTWTENGRITASVSPKAASDISQSVKRSVNICSGLLVLEEINKEIESLVEYLSTSFAPKISSTSTPSNSKYSREKKRKSSTTEELRYVPLTLTLMPDAGEIVIETSTYHMESLEKLLKEKFNLMAEQIREEGHREPYLADGTLLMKAGEEVKEVALPYDAKTIFVYINEKEDFLLNEKEKIQLSEEVRTMEKLSHRYKAVTKQVMNEPGLWGFIRFRNESDAIKFLEDTERFQDCWSFKRNIPEVPKRRYELTLTRHIDPSDFKYLHMFTLLESDSVVWQTTINDKLDIDGCLMSLHKPLDQSTITVSNVKTTLSRETIETILDYLNVKYHIRLTFLDLYLEYSNAALSPEPDGYMLPRDALQNNFESFLAEVGSYEESESTGSPNDISSNLFAIEVFTASEPENIERIERAFYTDDIKLLQCNESGYGRVNCRINISHIVVIRKIIYSVTAAEVNALRLTLEEKHCGSILLTTEIKSNGDAKVTLTGSNEVRESLNAAARELDNISVPATIKVTKDHRLCMESPLGRATVRILENDNDVKILLEGTKIEIYGSTVGKQKCLIDLRPMIEDCIEHTSTIDLLQYGEGHSVISSLRKKFGFHLEGMSRRIGSLVGLDESRANVQVKGFDARKRVITLLYDLEFECSQDLNAVICSACFSKPEQPFMRLSICGHSYCWECLEGQIMAALSSRDIPIMCVEDGCTCLIPWQDMRMVLRNRMDVFRKLLDVALGLYVSNNKDALAFCPSPGCDMFYYSGVRPEGETSTTECLSCLVEICAVCQTAAHPGVQCDKNRQEASDFPQDLRDWMEKECGGRRKLCPTCTQPIEIYGDCPYVRCTACRQNFQWRYGVAVVDNHMDNEFDETGTSAARTK